MSWIWTENWTSGRKLGRSNLDEVMRYAHPFEGRKRDAIQLMSMKSGRAKAAQADNETLYRIMYLLDVSFECY